MGDKNTIHGKRFHSLPLYSSDRQVVIDVPWYGGGMSCGSVSPATMVGKAHASCVGNTFSCTGEGGYPPHSYPYYANVITL
jgi:glutamate synthase domain-containing protein 2